MGSEYMESLFGNSCVNVMCKELIDCVYFVGSTKPLYEYYDTFISTKLVVPIPHSDHFQ